MVKSNKRRALCSFVGLFTLLLAFAVPALAGVAESEGEYEIYPTPQSIVYGAGTTALTEEVNVFAGGGIDEYTKTRIEETLETQELLQAPSQEDGNTNMTVGIYGSGDAADQYGKSHNVDASIYEEYDAYTLWIDNGDIVILGKNTDAAYYGVTTFKRILEQIKEKSVKNLTIKDYAEIEFRGFIEGYYGNPWSKEDRIDLMQFGGEIKMNQYIYAPKDDPLHNKRWRELYDEAGLKDIEALAKAGNESKCFFVYALHPFMNNPVNLSDATYDAELKVVQAKFEQVIRNAGVRQISILEDDATGESAERVIRFLNDMQEWLEELKKEIPDLKTDILYCPTCYMATTDAKMTAISEGVSEKIHILVTGGKIWGEVSQEFSTAFFNGLNANGKGRYPYMWVNWPCNDNTKNSQIMGGHNYILHTGIEPASYEGIVLNPIQESESSKVGIFTAADYCWNIWQDAQEGDQAWDDAFKYIDHMTPIETEESLALREVAKHQIAQSPDQTTGKQVPFEESVELKPLLEAFLAKLDSGTYTSEEILELQEEFQTIYDAADLYLERGTNRRTAAQMKPFFSCLRDLAQAGVRLMQTLKANMENDSDGVWEHFSAAQSVYEKSKTYGFSYFNAGTLYAKAGRKYIEPFVSDVMEYLSSRVITIVNPEYVESGRPYEVAGISKSEGWSVYEGSESNLTDGNDSTSVWYRVPNNKTVVGDYIQIDLGENKKVGNVRAVVGAGNGDKWIKYHVAYSTDGVNFTDITPSYVSAAGSTKDIYTVNLGGVRARYIRLVNDEEVAKWVYFSEFAAYPVTAEAKYTGTVTPIDRWVVYNGATSNLTDGNDNTIVWYDTKGEGDDKDCTLVGDYIEFDLEAVKPVGRVRAVVGAGDAEKWTKYHVSYSTDRTNWTDLPSYQGQASGKDIYVVNLGGQEARYVRLVNDERLHKWVKFSEFSVYSYVETDWFYSNLEDSAGWNVDVSESSDRFSITAKQNVTLKPNEYIGLKLDRLHEVSEITVDGSDPINGLTVEKAANQLEWNEKDDLENAARYIRLINKTNADVTFDLTTFEVTTSELKPSDFLESNIGGADHAEDARKLGTTKYLMDGDLTTKAKFCATQKSGDYVTYDLGQEITLRSLRVYVLDTALDYPRDAKIQASVDNSTWTDILTIGDGEVNPADEANTKPIEMTGPGWAHDTVDVAYAYAENAAINNVKARYLRLIFTANYSSRWLELNEIRINGGEYIPDVNDPTYQTDAKLMKGFEPSNLFDNNLTTAFQPDSSSANGSFIYRPSDKTKFSGFNILQSGNAISNANVSVRTADGWEEVGTLYRSFSCFDTSDMENIFEIKIEWENTVPVIYEIIMLENNSSVSQTLERNQADAQRQAQEASERLQTAQAALADITAQANTAKQAWDAETDKTSAEALRKEAEYYTLLAKQYGAESEVAEAQALKATGEAELARAQAQILLREAAGMPDGADKTDKIQQAEEKLGEIPELLATASTKRAEAQSKKTSQKETQKLAEEAQSKYEEKVTIFYDITFESNQGSAVEGQRVKEDGKVERPTNPIREGFIFDKWYSDAAMTTPYNFRAPVKSNLTLYAKWLEKCTVTFDSKGGSNVPAQIVGKGLTAEKPSDPTKEGVAFGGWYSDEQCQTAYDFATVVTGDITLYAKWIEACTVTFDSKGGSTVKSQIVGKGLTAEKPSDPTKAGYVFGGWHSDEQCQTAYDFTAAVTGDITLYAKWIEAFTVAFDSKGGSTVRSQIVGKGLTAEEPSAPTKTGYTFGGWYVDEQCQTAYDFDTAVTANITLYAKWTAKGGGETETYTVTFDSQGGTEVESQTVNKDEQVTEPEAPTKSGYTFGGWYKEASCVTAYDFNTAVTADLTLYAKWTAKGGGETEKYTVTFDSQGGTEVEPQTVNKDEKVTEPEAPTKSGYTFGGWYEEASCDTEYDFDTAVTSDLTLYAKWTAKGGGETEKYTVTFDSQGGTEVEPQTVNKDEKVTEPEAPTKSGYTFGGWYEEASCDTEYDFDTAVTSDFTLYAKWTANGGVETEKYTVTFDSKGGTKVASQTKKKNELAVEPKPAPTKTGFKFDGWYDKATNKKFNFKTTKITKNIALYAKWIPIYTVTFVSNGGTNVAAQKVEQNKTITKVTVTKANYIFDGWYTDKAFKNKFSETSKITKNIVLYAKWMPALPEKGKEITVGDLVYKITFSHASEGTVAVSGVKKSVKKVTIPPTVKIGNITFKVTSIASKAFTKAKKLNKVEIGANITKIDSKAFYNLKKLKTITFKTLKAPKIASKAFKGTHAKCKVTVPKKMSKKEFNKLKNNCKKGKISKKTSYNKK